VLAEIDVLFFAAVAVAVALGVLLVVVSSRRPTPWDVRFNLDVGVQERHEVEFRWAQGKGETRFFVDGNQVFYDKTYIGVSLSRTFEFDVGQPEHHLVTVVRTRRPPFSDTRKHDFSVYVDGRQVGEY
jgi:hypothetical protein